MNGTRCSYVVEFFVFLMKKRLTYWNELHIEIRTYSNRRFSLWCNDCRLIIYSSSSRIRWRRRRRSWIRWIIPGGYRRFRCTEREREDDGFFFLSHFSLLNQTHVMFNRGACWESICVCLGQSRTAFGSPRICSAFLPSSFDWNEENKNVRIQQSNESNIYRWSISVCHCRMITSFLQWRCILCHCWNSSMCRRRWGRGRGWPVISGENLSQLLLRGNIDHHG